MMSDSLNKNTSGEKDFKEIDSEIKKVVVEGKSPNDTSLFSINLAYSPKNQTNLYTNENNIWKEQSRDTDDSPSKYNMKFLNYNKIHFLRAENKFTNFNSSSTPNNFNANSNMQYSNHHPDYFIEENENLITNQISHMKIKSNNLMKLNTTESFGGKSFTDPCCEEDNYYAKVYPKFFENEPDNRMFPVIEGKNRNYCQNDDNSFDYSNLNDDGMTEENINYINNINQNMNPRFLLNRHSSNFSTNESLENSDKKYSTPKHDMFFNNNLNITRKKINFQNAQNYFNNNPENQSNQFENIYVNHKASSFCNPSDYYINKQLLYCHNQDTNPPINYQNNSLNNISKLFSPNLEVQSEKKKLKKDQIIGENKYFIYLENILSCVDRRTTLMIKNIPNKYNSRSLLEEININFRGKYDFFYLPLDFYNNCNLGFAFMNLVDPMHILLFYDIFNGKKWKKFKSDKICELAYAKFQGKKELLLHFEKSSIMTTNGESKKPMVFIPSHNQKIELPLKYFEILKDYYPSCQFQINNNKIVIESLFR